MSRVDPTPKARQGPGRGPPPAERRPPGLTKPRQPWPACRPDGPRPAAATGRLRLNRRFPREALLVDLGAGRLSSKRRIRKCGNHLRLYKCQECARIGQNVTEGACLGSQRDQKPSAKPFLRWAGSKRQQLSRLVQFWKPSHQRYIEPFAGSACLFFEIAPTRAILGDNNDSLIEVYRIVRDQPDRLFDRLCRIRRDAESYYRWRAKAPASLDAETRRFASYI